VTVLLESAVAQTVACRLTPTMPSTSLMTTFWHRTIKLIGIVVATSFIAACAVNTPRTTQNDAQDGPFTGRISLLVQSEPVQSFAGSFELSGTVEQGELRLYTPLGSTAAQMRWSPGNAQLQNGTTVQAYPSVDAMLERTTGAAVPITALFAWLRGQSISVPGWQADLSRQSEGRINAQRTSPAPTAQLRIVLER
jgi:outer membrane lipoprotein LolB